MAIISISISDELINKIDKVIKKRGYMSRSELVREALRRFFSEEEISEDNNVIASIIIIIEQEKKDVEGKMMGILHRYSTIIMNFNHIRDDDYDKCIVSIICKGRGKEIQGLLLELRRLRGKIIIRESIIPVETT